ncbi:hypothetical protein FE257_010155 [Aspergillus nanangensis]|uniref:CHY and RING finger domain protein n=1 Tax=Aspergillus nanangensis TaxID=2582783 RepID=A0AAD4CJM7_ASPNN|nr:hypothetical protein FE257_010155 [Aspergillus nanangensis]
MSGLISSLLIEPVVRQARRLSQQTDHPPPPAADTQPEHTTTNQTQITSKGGRVHNGHTNVMMSDLESDNQYGAGLHTEGAESNNDPSSSPTPPPIDENRQPDSTGGPPRSPPDQIDGTWNNVSLQTIDGRLDSISGHRASPASSGRDAPDSMSTATTYHTSLNVGDIERLSDNTLDVDGPGAHFWLPEDDGMGILRKRIHAIRDLQSTNMDKARLIHELMTENYNASRAYFISNIATSNSFTPSSPRSLESAENSTSRWSAQSFDQSSITPESVNTMIQFDTQYNLTAEDLKPTFAPKTEPDPPPCDEDLDTEEVEEIQLGCQHYKRNVKLQCHACKKWYTCRFCHDEVEDHNLDRPRTENMLCMFCGHPQPAAQACRQCGEQAAQYYCNTCKLWDNDSHKSIYHCADCGICRIGQGLGKDFFHCKTCSVCLPMSIENTHRCIERSTQCNCPICGEYMFTSPETVVFMRCGHSIHQKCLSEHSNSSHRCPICNKTITNMETIFRNLDRAIQSQPMPSEFTDTKALVYCNDCGVKSVVKYHWLGLKCDMCESYNTAQLRLLHSGTPDIVGQEDGSRDVSLSRMRSSSHSLDDMASALTALRVNTSALPDSNSELQASAPASTEAHPQSTSYNLTHGRAVSPVISNYFGIPPDRGSERRKSVSFFGGRTPTDNENEGEGELRFWGTKFKYRYGFLSREAESADGTSGSDEDVGDGSSEGCDSEDEEYEEDDDDDERIDIIGHR